MRLRTAFLVLLFANLAYLGWAELIDVPSEPPPANGIAKLPQLKLLSEVQRTAPAPGQPTQAVPAALSVPPGAPATAAAGPGSVSETGAASGAGPTPGFGAASGNGAGSVTGDGSSARAASGAAISSTSASSTSASSTGASPTGRAPQASVASRAAAVHAVTYDPAGDAAASAAAAHRCVTIGPFTSQERAGEARDLLRERGFAPRQRTEPSGPPSGYWVFIGDLKSASDQARIVNRLERSGISDAKAMPGSDGARRVSVGLFSTRGGAERRARAVQHLGLEPIIEPRRSIVASWLDVSLDSSSQSLPAEGLLSVQQDGSRLEIKECPPGESAPDSGSSRAQGTAGSRAPGRAKPPATTPDFKPQIPKALAAEGRPRPG